MKRSSSYINVASLKAKLAMFLRQVKTGEELVITDRQVPIAKIVPFSEDTGFKLLPAKEDFSRFSQQSFPKIPILENFNSTHFLLEDRKKR